MDILGTSITSTWKKIKGVEVVTIDDRRGYRLQLVIKCYKVYQLLQVLWFCRVVLRNQNIFLS